MISVIVPHLDQAEALRRCLASLCSQEGVAQPVELIVVDNGSDVLPVEVCSAFAGVRFCPSRLQVPGRRAISERPTPIGDVLAFIDADCIADRGWLSQIERCFSENAEIAILGGDVRIACQNPRRPTLLEAYESVFAYRMKEYIAKQGYTGTGNLAVRADVFAAVGPFAGIEIAEDRDWGQRALRLGYRTSLLPGHDCLSSGTQKPRRTCAEMGAAYRPSICARFNRSLSGGYAGFSAVRRSPSRPRPSWFGLVSPTGSTAGARADSHLLVLFSFASIGPQ